MSVFTKIISTIGALFLYSIIGGLFIETGNEGSFRFLSLFLTIGLIAGIRAIWKQK